jgi:hypothetical protein
MDNEPKNAPNRDACFFFAGSLRGFAESERCPKADRGWIRRAAEQFVELAKAYWLGPPAESESADETN